MREIAFAPDAVRRAFAGAAARFVELVHAIPTDRWDHPGLGVWSVRDLTGHAGGALTTITTYLAAGRGAAVELEHPFDYYAVLLSSYADDEAIAARGRQRGAELGGDPPATIERWRDEALTAMTEAADDAPVATPAGVMRMADYLPSRVFELVVHAGDLGAATGVPVVVDREAAVVSLVLTAHLAAERGVALDTLLALTGRRALPDGYSLL